MLFPSIRHVAASSSSATRRMLHSTATLRRRTFKTKFYLPDPVASTALPLTKIVGTIGPTSEQAEPLKDCVNAGLKAMRLNFSHATPEEVEMRCTNLTAAIAALPSSQALGVPQNTVTILLDTKGPEIRTGKLANDTSGHDTVDLVAGNTITLHSDTDKLPAGGSTASDLYIDFKPLSTVLLPGRQVLLDDGAVVLVVEKVHANTVRCTIQNTGTLRSRAGVNLPLADTAQHLPALSEKDKADIAYGMKVADIDVIAASFVQTSKHVTDILAYIIKLRGDSKKRLPLIIAKIETATALENFDEILDASDGIMVARGDLGVEIPLTQVTNAQKVMVAACNAVGKPVIVATQMLESMTKNPRPTRAEVSDVTNAVYDGADAVMCSGETAKGKYPVATISTMQDIIVAAEHFGATQLGSLPGSTGVAARNVFDDSPSNYMADIAKNSVDASHKDTTIKGLVVDATSWDKCFTGLVAAYRPNVPIYVVTTCSKQARQLQLYRGVYPVIVKDLHDSGDAVAAVRTVTGIEAAEELFLVERP